ncbi:uncharacterized protein LOC114946818 [Acropora millepora]|uniref:uncharacterized protein LOC114946818 n=1 Tax=Acropora millepora TaxID=45264 RepID=UPI001CF1959B|nr:uncharacterized protein LOC114946818 [Acropora millepora]
MAVLCIIVSLIWFPALTSTSKSCNNNLSEYGFALLDHVYKSFLADRLASCYISCNMQPACQSLNYNLADKSCELNNETKYFQPRHFVEKPTYVYAENPDSEHPWRKLNSAPVCFGAKDSQFGQFQVEFGGSIKAVKLSHLYGLVTCGKGWMKWGCVGNRERLNVLVTNASNSVLLPMGNTHKNYKLPGYHSNSTVIVFNDFPSPLQLSPGQELRLWFTTDYNNYHESDNGGTTCADMFAKYS